MSNTDTITSQTCVVTRLCPVCEQVSKWNVNAEQWFLYSQGYLSADKAFKTLTDDEWLQFISGVHEQCYRLVTGKKTNNINIKEQ